MSDSILNNLYMVLLLPLWIFLMIMAGRFFSVYINNKIIYICTLLSSFCGGIFCLFTFLKYNGEVIEKQIPFIKVEDFVLNYGIYIDKESLIFGTILFLISFLVQLFSISYMQNEKKKYRYWGLLNFFNFAMASLIFSPNLFQFYFFWEIIAVISYLLIGFDYYDNVKSKASQKVFILNRFGDMTLLMAIVLSSYFMYSYTENIHLTTLAFSDLQNISAFLYAYTSRLLYLLICLLFLISAYVKSAQIPFYNWLQDAMEAKLPVSALLHSATLVTLGVLLLIKIYPLLIQETMLLKTLTIMGLLTALVCSVCACVGNNPKKVLAYSTSAQLGLVFCAIGCANIKFALILFITHSLAKSFMFVTLPEKTEKWNYVNFGLFIFSGMSICGIILSGLISKELLLSLLDLQTFRIIYFVIVFLTAFYVIKIALITAKNNSLILNKNDVFKLSSFVIFVLSNIIFYIILKKHVVYSIKLPFFIAIAGSSCAFILYKTNAFIKIPVLYKVTEKGFYLSGFYDNFVCKIYQLFTNILDIFEQKCLTNYRYIINLLKLKIKIADWTENNVINRSVRIISTFSKKFSFTESKLQKGNIQWYNKYAIIIICTVLIITFTTMFSYIWGK